MWCIASLRTNFDFSLLLSAEISFLSEKELLFHGSNFLLQSIDFSLIIDLDGHHFFLNFLFMLVCLQLSNLLGKKTTKKCWRERHELESVSHVRHWLIECFCKISSKWKEHLIGGWRRDIWRGLYCYLRVVRIDTESSRCLKDLQ